MSRILICVLGLCVIVLAADEAAAPAKDTAMAPPVKSPIVDTYERFNLEEDLKPAAESSSGMESNDKIVVIPAITLAAEDKNSEYISLVASDIKPDDKVGAAMPDIHLGNATHSVPLDSSPEYVISNANKTVAANDSNSEQQPMETTTKKTFIMKIPTKSPMLDAIMNSTMMMHGNKTMDMMMQDAPGADTTVKTGVVLATSPTMLPAQAKPGDKTTSSHLVGSNSTGAPTSVKLPASSSNMLSPAFIVAILAMLGSRLC